MMIIIKIIEIMTVMIIITIVMIIILIIIIMITMNVPSLTHSLISLRLQILSGISAFLS